MCLCVFDAVSVTHGVQSCPCVHSLTDCDPDLCVTCGASEMHLTCSHTQHSKTTKTTTAAKDIRGHSNSSSNDNDEQKGQNAPTKAAAQPQQTCCNMPLTIQHPAPLKLGVSKLSGVGFGAYNQYKLKKGQFICEYVGEQVRGLC